ncbi:hypothetical protein CO678_15960 [Bradyrhizobium diazoefficiens]|nr:hypothetical protein CO678_15960 [Bradyrhizobium diazoefficiens]
MGFGYRLCWRADYNDARPHSQLGWNTPSGFALHLHPRRIWRCSIRELPSLPPPNRAPKPALVLDRST